MVALWLFAEVLPGHTFRSHVDHGMLRNAGAGSTPQMHHISSPPSPHTMATSASSRPPFRRGSVIVNFVILQSPDCIPQLSHAFRDIPRHSVVTRLAFRLHSAAFRVSCARPFATAACAHHTPAHIRFLAASENKGDLFNSIQGALQGQAKGNFWEG